MNTMTKLLTVLFSVVLLGLGIENVKALPVYQTANHQINTSGLVLAEEPPEDCKVLGSKFYRFIKSAFIWIQVGGPIIALILSLVDFASAILSGEEDAKKKAVKNVKTRLIAAGLLIIIPFILQLILNLVDNLNGSTCNL